LTKVRGVYPFSTKLTMTNIPRADGTVYDSACSAALVAPQWIITAGHCFHRDSARLAGHDHATVMTGTQHAIDAADTVIPEWPTEQAELDRVAASRAWPPRLPDQPIFYPVLNRWYATKIAREWNVTAGGVGYVTRFEVQRALLDRSHVQPRRHPQA
jgi:hypothetical protein